MRRIQNCHPRPDPTVEQKIIRPSAPSNSISRACVFEAAGTRIFKRINYLLSRGLGKLHQVVKDCPLFLNPALLLLLRVGSATAAAQ